MTDQDEHERPGMGRLLTTPELLHFLQISRTTLWRHMKDPAFPRPVQVGVGRRKLFRWDQNELRRWLAQRQQE